MYEKTVLSLAKGANMKRIAIMVVVAAVMVCAPFARADSDKLITGIADQTANSMVFLTCEFEPDSATQAAAGPAICIDKSGVFLSLSFNASMRNAKVKACKIYRSGPDSTPLTAELVAIDRETGMAFVKCTDSGAPKWSAVTFAAKSDLSIGTQVVSVSLMPGDASRARYFGRASISAVLDVPRPLVYVTGGSLTSVCSPVFSAPGKAIGLVWRQSPQIANMTFGRQQGIARISPVRESTFFTPAEEFNHVIEARGARPLAWTGILSMRPADKEVLSGGKTGIRVAKIIPGGPAEKAGLKELDVIVQINGKDLPKMPSPALMMQSVRWQLSRKKVGDKVTFKLATEGKSVTLTLELMPDGPTEVPRFANQRLGFLARDKAQVDPYLTTNPALKAKGVVVVSVGKDSPAIRADLQRGDVITSIGAQPVEAVATMRALLKNILADGKEKKIAVMVQRKSESVPLIIRVPKKP